MRLARKCSFETNHDGACKEGVTCSEGARRAFFLPLFLFLFHILHCFKHAVGGNGTVWTYCVGHYMAFRAGAEKECGHGI